MWIFCRGTLHKNSFGGIWCGCRIHVFTFSCVMWTINLQISQVSQSKLVEGYKTSIWENHSLLAEVSHDEAKMRERRESLSFLSFLPRRERPLLAGKENHHNTCIAFWKKFNDVAKLTSIRRVWMPATKTWQLYTHTHTHTHTHPPKCDSWFGCICSTEVWGSQNFVTCGGTCLKFCVCCMIKTFISVWFCMPFLCLFCANELCNEGPEICLIANNFYLNKGSRQVFQARHKPRGIYFLRLPRVCQLMVFCYHDEWQPHNHWLNIQDGHRSKGEIT